MVVSTSYEKPAKAARVQFNGSCDQPDKREGKDPLSSGVSCLFHPEDTGGGGLKCAPGEINGCFYSILLVLFARFRFGPTVL